MAGDRGTPGSSISRKVSWPTVTLVAIGALVLIAAAIFPDASNFLVPAGIGILVSAGVQFPIGYFVRAGADDSAGAPARTAEGQSPTAR